MHGETTHGSLEFKIESDVTAMPMCSDVSSPLHCGIIIPHFQSFKVTLLRTIAISLIIKSRILFGSMRASHRQ